MSPTPTAHHGGMRKPEIRPKVNGHFAYKEQCVVAWDCVLPRTGLLEETCLDVATRDAATGHNIFVDAVVTCAHSGYEPRQRARAGKHGVAAADAVRGAAVGDRLRRPWPLFALGARALTMPNAPR